MSDSAAVGGGSPGSQRSLSSERLGSSRTGIRESTPSTDPHAPNKVYEGFSQTYQKPTYGINDPLDPKSNVFLKKSANEARVERALEQKELAERPELGKLADLQIDGHRGLRVDHVVKSAGENLGSNVLRILKAGGRVAIQHSILEIEAAADDKTQSQLRRGVTKYNRRGAVEVKKVHAMPYILFEESLLPSLLKLADDGVQLKRTEGEAETSSTEAVQSRPKRILKGANKGHGLMGKSVFGEKSKNGIEFLIYVLDKVNEEHSYSWVKQSGDDFGTRQWDPSGASVSSCKLVKMFKKDGDTAEFREACEYLIQRKERDHSTGYRKLMLTIAKAIKSRYDGLDPDQSSESSTDRVDPDSSVVTPPSVVTCEVSKSTGEGLSRTEEVPSDEASTDVYWAREGWDKAMTEFKSQVADVSKFDTELQLDQYMSHLLPIMAEFENPELDITMKSELKTVLVEMFHPISKIARGEYRKVEESFRNHVSEYAEMVQRYRASSGATPEDPMVSLLSALVIVKDGLKEAHSPKPIKMISAVVTRAVGPDSPISCRFKVGSEKVKALVEAFRDPHAVVEKKFGAEGRKGMSSWVTRDDEVSTVNAMRRKFVSGAKHKDQNKELDLLGQLKLVAAIKTKPLQ